MSDRGKAGRHRKYSPLYPAQVRERCMHGATNAELATLLAVHPWTILRWSREHEEFGTAIREGRAAAAEFRISQMPPLPPMFPNPTPAQPRDPHGQPIIKVERIFVEPPIRDR